MQPLWIRSDDPAAPAHESVTLISSWAPFTGEQRLLLHWYSVLYCIGLGCTCRQFHKICPFLSLHNADFWVVPGFLGLKGFPVPLESSPDIVVSGGHLDRSDKITSHNIGEFSWCLVAHGLKLQLLIYIQSCSYSVTLPNKGGVM
jgi:hypothetical protein